MYITTSNPSTLYDLTNASLNSGELTQRVNSAMASGAIAPQTSFPLCRKPIISYLKPISISSLSSQKSKPRAKKDRIFIANSMAAEEMKAIPVMVNEESGGQVVVASQVNDLVSQGHGTLSYGGIPLPSGSGNNDNNNNEEDFLRLMDRGINAAIVLAAGTFAVTKLLTIDSDSWHGWTLYEIIRYAPQHNWTAYEEALKENPVLAKMVISGVVYSLGDWIAQCVEGKPLFEFDRTRMFRSGLVGFTLHGSLSHYYYQICEELFPFQGWWVVPVKVAFDQTVWSGIWNSIYFTVLGFLRFENPANIFSELTATFWPMLTAGWKLWPFAHLITYGLIPVEQRLLWVDCVELIWVTILSTLSNEKSEARIAETPEESSSSSTPTGPLEE